MEKIKSLKSYKKLSSIIIISIVLVIFGYIGYDFFIFSPKYKHKVDNVGEEVVKLKKYLDKKIPEIDSTIIIQKREYEKLKNVNLKLN